MPTFAEFKAYETVRKSGKFNMVTEASSAAAMAGISMNSYWNVLKNYDWCSEAYSAGNPEFI